jgi:hypothetical protein
MFHYRNRPAFFIVQQVVGYLAGGGAATVQHEFHKCVGAQQLLEMWERKDC